MGKWLRCACAQDAPKGSGSPRAYIQRRCRSFHSPLVLTCLSIQAYIYDFPRADEGSTAGGEGRGQSFV